MSADFWGSSQREKWQYTRHSLMESRRRLLLLEKKMVQNGLIKDYPNIVYDYNMRIHLHNSLIKLGRRLNVRQLALASAEVYLARFLTRVSLKEINVYLLVTACLYVACKIEECPQHIRLIISEARNLWPEYIPHDTTKLGEFEFYLIEEMGSYLLLHHPYNSLLQIRDFLNDNIDVYGFTLNDDEMQHCWSLINDSYITDLHILFPPHIICVSAIYITVVLKKHLSSLRVENNSSDNMMVEKQSDTPNSTDKLDTSAMHIDDLITMANGSESTPSRAANISPTANSLDPSNFQDTKLDEDTIKINKFMNFLNHSHINLDEVVEAMQDMVNLYVLWNRYNENTVKKALQHMLLNR